jgi:hypothetical protein
VCLEPCDRPCVVEPCCHTFCFDCVDAWTAMQAKASRHPSCPLCKRVITHLLYDISSPFEFKRLELRNGMKLPAPTGWARGCDSHAHRFRRRVYLHNLSYTGKRLAIPSGTFPGLFEPHGAITDSGGKSSSPVVTTARLRRFMTRELQALLQIEDVGMIQSLVEGELNKEGSRGIRLCAVETPRRESSGLGVFSFLKSDSSKFIAELEAFYAADTSVAMFDQSAQYYGPLPAPHDSAEAVHDETELNPGRSSGSGGEGEESGHSITTDERKSPTSKAHAESLKRKRAGSHSH